MNDPLDMPATEAAVVCRDATVTYPGGVCALDRINLSINHGERVALIGPSGCGKTTLLRAIAGLQPLTSGSCRHASPRSPDRRTGATSFVFQQPALLPWCSVLDNVVLPLTLGRRDRSSQRDRQQTGRRALTEVDLADASERFPNQLSGGMQMRVSIARALVTRPQFLLLDEPFAALDDLLRNQLGRLLLDLWRTHHFTSVLVTHNIAEAICLSERIFVMHQGRVERELINPLDTLSPTTDLRRTRAFAEFYGHVSDELESAAVRRSGHDTATHESLA